MTELLSVNPRAEYLSIINQSPRLQAWHNFHEKTLPEMIGKPDIKTNLNNIIHYHLRSNGNLLPDAYLPEVQWTQDEPVIKQITGGNLAIPVMEFPEEMMPVYEHIAGKSAGGATLTIPIEIISLGQLSNQQSINSPLILLRDKKIIRSIPYEERRQHELTHAIDPNIDERKKFGGELLNEIIAIIGSYSDSFSRYTSIVLHPPYIIPYLLQELESAGIQEMPQDEFLGMVSLINHIVYKSTHTLPKIPNDQVVRRMMKYKSMEELAQDWPELFE